MGVKWVKDNCGYFRSLACAESEHGEKVPAGGYVDSGTFTDIQRVQGVVSTNGNYGIVLGGCMANGGLSSFIPSPAAATWGNASAMAYCIGATTNTATVDTLPFSTASTTAGALGIQYPSFSVLQGIGGPVDQWRLVSASMRVELACSETTNSGVITANSLPAGYFAPANALGTYSLTSLSNTPGAMVTPVNKGGVTIRWVPLDLSTLNYVDSGFSPANWGQVQPYDVGCMFAYVSGAVAGTTVIVTIVRNWEFLPTTGNILFGISPCINDTEALDFSFNHMQEIQLVTTSPGGFVGEQLANLPGTVAVSPDLTNPITAAPQGAGSLPGQNAWFRFHEAPLGKKRRPGTRAVSKSYNEQVAPPSSLFDKVVDTLIPIAQKFLPSVLPMLGSLF